MRDRRRAEAVVGPVDVQSEERLAPRQVALVDVAEPEPEHDAVPPHDARVHRRELVEEVRGKARHVRVRVRGRRRREAELDAPRVDPRQEVALPGVGWRAVVAQDDLHDEAHARERVGVHVADAGAAVVGHHDLHGAGLDARVRDVDARRRQVLRV